MGGGRVGLGDGLSGGRWVEEAVRVEQGDEAMHGGAIDLGQRALAVPAR